MDNQTNRPKWYDKIWLVITLCIIVFPLGLYALWKNQSISKGWKIGVTVVLALIILGQSNKDDKVGSSTADNSSSRSNKQTEQGSKVPKSVGVGEILRTEHFNITVNKVSANDRVDTGNEFADLKREEGNSYLIINASFKNTDTESRMLLDGSVWINYNGKNYEFDKAETIMLEGWGLLLDQINPLTTKTTNLVYKIPSEIKGNAYWQPGRAGKDQKIFLGNLK
jgi:hypothetical protein